MWHHDQVDFIHIRQGEVNTQKSINMTHHTDRLKGEKKKQDQLDTEKNHSTTIWQPFKMEHSTNYKQ